MTQSPSASLQKLSGLGLEWLEERGVLRCTSPHAFVRAAGYLKHVYGQSGARVVFRGQTKLWSPLLPSLFRAAKPMSPRTQARQSHAIDAYVAEARRAQAFIRGTRIPYESAHEPLLQHYGVRTRWLDAVDNVWVALWFAVFDCVVDPKAKRFWHFVESSRDSAYVLLVSPGANERPVAGKAGLFETDDAELIDLRVAAPSLYVRPHAQHGLLLRKKIYAPGQMALDTHVVGILEVERTQAKAWLGRGFLHAPHVVFPPPHYDAGYKRLVEKAPPPPSSLGAIGLVFP